jgi:hypothetical protein
VSVKACYQQQPHRGDVHHVGAFLLGDVMPVIANHLGLNWWVALPQSRVVAEEKNDRYRMLHSLEDA